MPNTVIRILAHTSGGGPLDDMLFSVDPEQATIQGFNDMTDNQVYTKDETTSRSLSDVETTMSKLLFHEAHDLTTYCEFIYSE